MTRLAGALPDAAIRLRSGSASSASRMTSGINRTLRGARVKSARVRYTFSGAEVPSRFTWSQSSEIYYTTSFDTLDLCGRIVGCVRVRSRTCALSPFNSVCRQLHCHASFRGGVRSVSGLVFSDVDSDPTFFYFNNVYAITFSRDNLLYACTHFSMNLH